MRPTFSIETGKTKNVQTSLTQKKFKSSELVKSLHAC